MGSCGPSGRPPLGVLGGWVGVRLLPVLLFLGAAKAGGRGGLAAPPWASTLSPVFLLCPTSPSAPVLTRPPHLLQLWSSAFFAPLGTRGDPHQDKGRREGILLAARPQVTRAGRVQRAPSAGTG